MFLEKETKDKFGYTPDSLSAKSSKKVVVRCDYCDDIYDSIKKRITNARELVKKDACVKCKFKKRADISVIKYGVDNVSKLKNVKDKIREANSERLKSEDYKRQVKETMLSKYGKKSAMHVDEFINKQKDTLQERYGVDNPMKIEGVAKEASKKMVQTKIDKGLIIALDGKTRPELARQKGFSRSHFGKLVVKYGLQEALKIEKSQSRLEIDMIKILEKNHIKYKEQVRIDNKIVDFKIGNILVECDGLYWHSDLNKPNSYHVEKYKTYTNNNYKPFFFREDEIRDKPHIIESMILNALGRSKRIFARKCNIVEGKHHSFIRDNHLMGAGRGHCYGLEYEGDLVATLQLKRIKDNNYEVSRFCSVIGVNVIGGFSKILKYIEKNTPMHTLKTFIDLRYGSGNYLSDFGFVRGKAYPSFKWTNGEQTFHRLMFKGRSGYDYGLFKIWDCGQLPFLKKY